MKTYSKSIILSAMLSLSLFGCNDESVESSNAESNSGLKGEHITILAGIDNTDSRVAYDDSGNGIKVNWSKNETIRIFQGTTGAGSEFTNGDAGGREFSGDVPADGSGDLYYGVYPSNLKLTDGKVSVDIATQSGLIGDNEITEFMVAETNNVNSQYTFRHKLALLKLTLTLPETVTATKANEVRIIGFHNKADYSLADGTFSYSAPGVLIANNKGAGFDIVSHAITVYVSAFPEQISENSVKILVNAGNNDYMYTIHSAKQFTASKVVPVKVNLSLSDNIYYYGKYATIVSEQPATDSDGIYLLNTARNVKYVQENPSEGKAYKMMKNMIISEEGDNWTPIGSKDTPFNGTFDGNSKSISGMYIKSTASFQGLFGYINGKSSSELAIVKNLDISNENSALLTTNNTCQSLFWGAVAGCALDNALIENCSSSLTMNVFSTAGCIVGASGYDGGSGTGIYGDGKSYANVTVRNCHASGYMSAYGWWGNGPLGIIGGIIGNNHGVVENCSHTGNIVVTNAMDGQWNSANYVGGIAGANGGTVKQCFNTGSIKCVKQQQCYALIGGIAGNPSPSGVAGVVLRSYIQDCYNTGKIEQPSANSGGIIAQAPNNAQLAVEIDRCYNIGSIDNAGGGIFGYAVGQSGNSNIYAFDIQYCLTSPTASVSAGQTNNVWIYNRNTRQNLGYSTDRFVLAADDASMMTKAAYTRQIGSTGNSWNWDFDNVWNIDEGASTPYLRNNLPSEKPHL